MPPPVHTWRYAARTYGPATFSLMNDEQKYLFDLQGFIVVENALGTDALEAMNKAIDDQLQGLDQDEQNATARFWHSLTWEKAFRTTLTNPIIEPYLADILGENFRLDHDYCDVIQKGLGPIGATLHGGPVPFDPTAYYAVQNGTIRTGLTVVAYNLHDVNPGDGGFACVPGGHKSDFRFPDSWKDLTKPSPIVLPVTGPAGTAIIFTEALVHGTLPWTVQAERRTAFYKYSPYPLGFAVPHYDLGEFDDLTDAQKAILEAPNARYEGRETDPFG